MSTLEEVLEQISTLHQAQKRGQLTDAARQANISATRRLAKQAAMMAGQVVPPTQALAPAVQNAVAQLSGGTAAAAGAVTAPEGRASSANARAAAKIANMVDKNTGGNSKHRTALAATQVGEQHATTKRQSRWNPPSPQRQETAPQASNSADRMAAAAEVTSETARQEIVALRAKNASLERAILKLEANPTEALSLLRITLNHEAELATDKACLENAIAARESEVLCETRRMQVEFDLEHASAQQLSRRVQSLTAANQLLAAKLADLGNLTEGVVLEWLIGQRRIAALTKRPLPDAKAVPRCVAARAAIQKAEKQEASYDITFGLIHERPASTLVTVLPPQLQDDIVHASADLDDVQVVPLLQSLPQGTYASPLCVQVLAALTPPAQVADAPPLPTQVPAALPAPAQVLVTQPPPAQVDAPPVQVDVVPAQVAAQVLFEPMPHAILASNHAEYSKLTQIPIVPQLQLAELPRQLSPLAQNAAPRTPNYSPAGSCTPPEAPKAPKKHRKRAAKRKDRSRKSRQVLLDESSD